MSDLEPKSWDIGKIIRLGLMMFVQFFIWGSWYVTAPNYLGTIGFGSGDFAWTYSVGPIAGILTPFFVGMIADRFFAAQRLLGVLHLLGAALMYFAATQMGGESPSPNFINGVLFGYMLTYFPTLALTNTLAMRNLADSGKEFPVVRVFGTIGWIVAGVALTALGWDTQINMFYLTSGAAALLAVYSFTLPHTPPTATGKTSVSDILGLDAARVLLKNRSYLVFLISSMLICIPLAFYYQITSRVVEMVELPIGQTMSYGQMSEIFFMLLMPLMFRRLGVKWMLAIGMLAWVARYALFALGAPDQVASMILIGVVIHGICYDFFFVTGQIYTDDVAPKHLRGQAQGLLVLFTLGLGMLIGAQLAGIVEGQHTTAESKAFKAEFAANGEKIKELTASIDDGTAADADAVKAEIAALEEVQPGLRRQELEAIEWKPLWGKPAIFAALVMVVFLVLFRDSRKPEGDEEPESASGTSRPPSAN